MNFFASSLLTSCLGFEVKSSSWFSSFFFFFFFSGYQFIHTEQHHLSFGLYGAFLSLHLFLQSLFAFLEHRRMRSPARPQHLRRSVALCIAAYQEDPDYLRKCLRSIRRISFPGLKVVLVVDGNRAEDRYMMDIFQEVMGGADQARSLVWKGNYHSDGCGGGGVRGGGRSTVHMEEAARVSRLVRSCRYSCVMQEWGGKREVMYTAFKALGDSVDYVQVRRPRSTGPVGSSTRHTDRRSHGSS